MAALTEIIRRPSVAGYAYPAAPSLLREDIARWLPDPPPARMRATAAVVPHGSYARCGAVLGATLSRIEIPKRWIIIGPSHADHRSRCRMMASGAYRTPLGEVAIDDRLADALMRACSWIEADEQAHAGEHAIEVVLPFLQTLGPADATLLPLIFASDDPRDAAALGDALADLVSDSPEPTLVIASTDLSHYRAEAQAARDDEALLGCLTALDGDGLWPLAREQGIVMCGLSAAAAVLHASRRLGATAGTVAGRATSVAAGGDPDSVIGYAGVIIHSRTT